MPETVAEGPKPEEVAVPAEATPQSKNVVLSAFGGLKNLKIQMKPEVKPAEGEVLVLVKA